MEDHEWNTSSYAELPRMTTDRPPVNTLTTTKSRSGMDIDLSGLYRMGRICRSIFDRRGGTKAYGPYPVDITHGNRGSTSSSTSSRRSSDDSYKNGSLQGSGPTLRLSRTSSSGSASSRSERKSLAKKMRK